MNTIETVEEIEIAQEIETAGGIETADGIETVERSETRRTPGRAPGELLASAGRLAAAHRRAARQRRRGFRGEVLGSLAVMGGFVVLAVCARALLAAAAPPPPLPPALSYPRAVLMDSESDEGAAPRADDPAPHTWLVDGFNLLHAAVLRGRDRREWWRAPARARVLELVGRLDAPGAEVVVVFDGQREPDEPEPSGEAGPRVVFADSADDWLVAAVRSAPDPSRVAVVTADRQVAERARHRGARVMGPATFARLCSGTGEG